MQLVIPLLLACVAPEPVMAPADGEPALVFGGEPPRNLLMISIDTLRRDHVAPFASDAGTPFLRDWLAASVYADDVQQCSNWTFPSTVCTLAGRYPESTGFVPKIERAHRAPVPEGHPALARMLRDQGFHTMLVSTNTWLSEEWNNDQGYVDSTLTVGGLARTTLNRGVAKVDALLDGQAPPGRWFLHVHVTEPHAPYDPPSSYLAELDALEPLWVDLSNLEQHYEATDAWPVLGEAQRALLEAHLRVRYRAEVSWLDDQLAGWFTDLQDRPWLDDTLVVLWSDHGEQFWERGRQSHAYHLGAEENDGILALWSPRLLPVRHRGPVHAVDLVPTVLFGLDLPPDDASDGVVLGTADVHRDRFASTVGRVGPIQSVTRDGYKLVFQWRTPELALFDRRLDRSEMHDIAVSEPAIRDALWSTLKPRVRTLEDLVPEHEVAWPDE